MPQGHCLCKAVRISADTLAPCIGACHCTTCRTWSGAPWFAVDCKGTVAITGETHITRYASSDWAERGFCSQCGTHLFYRLVAEDKYILSSGIFDDAIAYTFDHQIFIDEKPPWYNFADKTHDLTGPEFFAQYAQQNETGNP